MIAKWMWYIFGQLEMFTCWYFFRKNKVHNVVHRGRGVRSGCYDPFRHSMGIDMIFFLISFIFDWQILGCMWNSLLSCGLIWVEMIAVLFLVHTRKRPDKDISPFLLLPLNSLWKHRNIPIHHSEYTNITVNMHTNIMYSKICLWKTETNSRKLNAKFFWFWSQNCLAFIRCDSLFLSPVNWSFGRTELYSLLKWIFVHHFWRQCSRSTDFWPGMKF